MKNSKFSKSSKKAIKRNPPRYIDMHIHSKYSDGDYEVVEIIATAHKLLNIIYDTLKNKWVFEDFKNFKIKTT